MIATQPQAVFVSRKAVRKEDGEFYVLIRSENGEMIRKKVETGFSDGARIEIVNGVSPGDTVYIETYIEPGEEKADETMDFDT